MDKDLSRIGRVYRIVMAGISARRRRDWLLQKEFGIQAAGDA
ncbi:MAG: hypothetical protein R3D69_13710 [Xanthobacteraceae bacterium]